MWASEFAFVLLGFFNIIKQILKPYVFLYILLDIYKLLIDLSSIGLNMLKVSHDHYLLIKGDLHLYHETYISYTSSRTPNSMLVTFLFLFLSQLMILIFVFSVLVTLSLLGSKISNNSCTEYNCFPNDIILTYFYAGA
jgi:hypothetical protein